MANLVDDRSVVKMIKLDMKINFGVLTKKVIHQ